MDYAHNPQLCEVNKTRLTIRGYHCDAYGHVNNARYLELYEEARWGLLQPAVDQHFFRDRGVIFVVVNINVSYKRPMVPDQVIDVVCGSIEYKNLSMVIHQKMIDAHNGKICSEADVTFVLLNSENKPQPVTDEIKDMFNWLMEQ